MVALLYIIPSHPRLNRSMASTHLDLWVRHGVLLPLLPLLLGRIAARKASNLLDAALDALLELGVVRIMHQPLLVGRHGLVKLLQGGGARLEGCVCVHSSGIRGGSTANLPAR